MGAAQSARRKLGRYEIVAEIARGGMGTVYLARLEGVAGFQRLFAIKLLHQHLADEERFVSMLLDEARLAARLHHPNAVGIVDVSDSNLGYYLVMEYVDGFTLDRLLRKLEDDPERRTRLGLRVLLDAANGLDAAHQLTDDDGNPLGIVHRDVSPQNVLVGTDGVGRITDFGVARAAARITASRPGMIKGKPCYMAPEQARGDDELDARADVFALGIILWEVLTGKMLFRSASGGAAVALMQVATMEIKPPSSLVENLPPALDDVCMKALTRDLDQRYQSAREMAKALEDAARSTGWLADSHVVADSIRELFENEIKIRKKAITTHTAELGRSSEPMLASDIYDVPRLKAARVESPTTPGKMRAKGEAWHETPADQRAQTPRASATPVHTTPMVTPPPGTAPTKRPMLLAAMLALVGAGLLGMAFFVLQDDRDEMRLESEAQREAERAAAEARAREAEARAAQLEAEAQRREEERVRLEAERALVESEVANGTESESESESDRSESEMRASMSSTMHTTMRATMEADPTMDGTMDSASMNPMSMNPVSMNPAFENNPYLTP